MNLRLITLYYSLLWLTFCEATGESLAVAIAGLYAMPAIVTDAAIQRLKFLYT